jgi:hypothetical protein
VSFVLKNMKDTKQATKDTKADSIVEEVRGIGMLDRGPIQAAKRTALALLAGHETARPRTHRRVLTR